MKGPDIHEAVATRSRRTPHASTQAVARNAEALRKYRERADLDPVSEMARNHRAHELMEKGARMEVPFLSDVAINFMSRLVVYRLLDMAHAFTADGGITESAAMILADAYPFIPETEEERRELWALVSAPPPETALFWRWAKAFENHIARRVKREADAAQGAA